MDSFNKNHRMRGLHGPRPPPLGVSRNVNSSKIKKPLLNGRHSPVIVHLRSPKIIHVRPQDFMGLVQRLTGKQASMVDSSRSSASSTSSSSRVVVADETVSGRDLVKGQEKYKSEADSGCLQAGCPGVYVNFYANWQDFGPTLR
ncbi:hypothetical protein L1049_007718 [Liquidambar formosana]|uniref:VQ domain-containing protein n=1 Tax=Liquidambar formosana TaxID=63359 RepID=A0AAP0S896_LIQFO